MSVRTILQPISLPVFLFSGVRSNRLVHLTNRDSDIYTDIINDDIICKYMDKAGDRYDPLRDKRFGISDMVDCIEGGSNKEYVDREDVNQHISGGGTVIIKDIGRFSDEGYILHNILGELDQVFQTNYSLWCNLYMSKERSGLMPHVDNNSIIVLQFKGKKQWDFFGETLDWRTNKPVNSVILSQGDFLYIPKWSPHVARNIPGFETGHATIEIPTSMDREAKYPSKWVTNHASS